MSGAFGLRLLAYAQDHVLHGTPFCPPPPPHTYIACIVAILSLCFPRCTVHASHKNAPAEKRRETPQPRRATAQPIRDPRLHLPQRPVAGPSRLRLILGKTTAKRCGSRFGSRAGTGQRWRRRKSALSGHRGDSDSPLIAGNLLRKQSGCYLEDRGARGRLTRVRVGCGCEGTCRPRVYCTYAACA